MLRITILYTKSRIVSGSGSLKVICPSCKSTYTKDIFFPDLWGRYPVKCEVCAAGFAPLYHLLNKQEIKVLWHRNNGEIKPKLSTDVWTPTTEIMVGEAETEEKEDGNNWFLKMTKSLCLGKE